MLFRSGVDYTITKAYQEIGPFEVASRYPLGSRGCCDALGDRSPVTIDAGAALSLRTDFERIGPLAGSGTLDLDYGVTAEAAAALREKGLYRKTLFTGVTALADGTRARLETGVVPGLGKAIKSVTFENGAVTLHLSRSGAVFVIR